MSTPSRPWTEYPLEHLCAHPTVLAIDPGGTTGWSAISVRPEALSNPKVSILENITLWEHGQIDCLVDEIAGVHELVERVSGAAGAVVLLEQFVIRRFDQKEDFLSPVRITAAFDYAARQLLGVRTYRQQPSEAMTTCTDARLKEWGLYERAGGMGHARDADRHGILWLRKAKDPKQGRVRRHEWWPHIYTDDGGIVD